MHNIYIMHVSDFNLCDCSHNCSCVHIYSFLEEYRKLLNKVKPKTIFEWGFGKSTHVAIESGGTVFSIEPEIKWVDFSHPNLSVLIASVGSEDYFSFHGRHNYDLFFVDCRLRAECLKLIYDNCKETAIVCLHDAQRKRYNIALKLFPNIFYLNQGFAVASKNINQKWI